MLKKTGGYVSCCALMLILLLALVGCAGGGSQAILDLVPLQMQLVSEYGGSQIVVELQNGNTLGITVTDDAGGALASHQRATQARKIAEFVCESYASMDRIETVRVSFARRQGGLLVITSDSSTSTFAKSELQCGAR